MIKFTLTGQEGNEYVYSAFGDNDEERGRCRFEINGFDLKITEICALDELEAEGLLRSSMNFAAGRGAYDCVYDCAEFCDMARRIGFEEKETLRADIPDVLLDCRH